MNKNCIIFFNAKAGVLKSTPTLKEFKRLVEQTGLDADVIATRSAKEMKSLIKSYIKQGVKRIAVAGGDGTIAKAIQELAYTDTILGIIPLGTANNFANALRLPLDLPSALRTLETGVVKEVSLGKINNHHYFTEGAGVGLFADALSLYGVGTNKNFIRGLYALIRLLFSFRSHRLKITVDGEPTVERASMCTVANIYRFSAALPIAPGAKLTDDKLDVVILGDLTFRELFSYYRAIRWQLHRNLPKVTYTRAKEITIDANLPLNVHCDDHIIGTTPITITAEVKALKVLVDRL